MKEIKLLDKLQERAVTQIRFGNRNLTLHVIEDMYNIVPLQERRKRHHLSLMYRLRLDNTGAWVIEVYPSLLCNRMSESVDLYIRLKLGIFSFI